jgi:putative spermidine/putrescine transport system ATP-binding protein
MLHEGKGAALRLEGLTKRFGKVGVPAVDNVDLEIAPGEFMTFLGPSGSGKTTTLNMIAGFLSVTSGRILVDGVDIVKTPTHKRNMGMVFQQYALFPHMTAAQNVAFPLEQRGIDKATIRSMVADALDLVHLGAYAERLPRQMSGGQQQRVAVARALVFNPGVLLMDEPLGALDKRLREQLQVEMSRIHRSLGLTFIFVTHDQEEALSLSDRIAVFNEGRIEQVGTATELYERPASLFVAGFLGDSTVMSGTVIAEGVNSDLGVLRVQANPDVPVGSRGAVVVRPERLTVSLDSVSADRNAVSAQVTDLVYLGSSRKLVLRLANGDPAIVRETAGQVSAAMPGDQVTLSWSIDDGVLVRATESELSAMSGMEISVR